MKIHTPSRPKQSDDQGAIELENALLKEELDIARKALNRVSGVKPVTFIRRTQKLPIWAAFEHAQEIAATALETLYIREEQRTEDE